MSVGASRTARRVNLLRCGVAAVGSSQIASATGDTSSLEVEYKAASTDEMVDWVVV